MSADKFQVNTRPMTLTDLNKVLAVTQEIEASGRTSGTYERFALPKLFGISVEGAGSSQKPDVLEVAKLMDLGLIAECNGVACGFIVGRQTYLAELDIQEGEIAIIGIHPDYRRKGVARTLVSAICDLFRSRGVSTVRVGIDPHDKDLLSFFGDADFSGDYLLYLCKQL